MKRTHQRPYQRRDWKAVAADYSSSGLGLAEFAKARKIPLGSLAKGLRRVKSKTRVAKRAAHTNGHFVQVGAPEMIEVSRNGTTVRIPISADTATIQRILAALNG